MKKGEDTKLGGQTPLPVQERSPVIAFLCESNAIENVYNANSLVDAFEAWSFMATKEVMNMDAVLRCHAILMEHQSLGVRDIGHFRKCGVTIAGRSVVDYRMVESSLRLWCASMNAVTTAEECKALHVEYEKIHPFIDGNGRTGRIFLNWARVKLNLPIQVIKAIDREAYYLWFREA